MNMDPIHKCCIDLEEKWKSDSLSRAHDKSHKKHNFLPLTELAVNLTNEFADKDLGRIDMYTASDFLRKRSLSSSTPLLLGLLYSRRWHQRQEDSKPNLSACTSAELFLVSMMVASKYLYDEGTRDDVFNDEWASDFPGMETEDLNRLESEFLREMDWDLFVRPSEFGDFLSDLEVRLAANIASSQRWRITSREMYVFLSSQQMKSNAIETLKLLLEAISLLLLVYACTLMSIYMSVVVVRYAHPAICNRLSRSSASSSHGLPMEIGCHNSSVVSRPHKCNHVISTSSSGHIESGAFSSRLPSWLEEDLRLEKEVNRSICCGLSRPWTATGGMRVNSVDKHRWLTSQYLY